jgi:UDP-2-acetamido-3-amino-2,3-dideoxy-glucuronate N-acetyltransferase
VNTKFFQHSQSLVESRDIGAGTRIWAFTHLMKGAKIGRHCNIGDHCFIESGVRIGNNVTIKNGVTIWDGVEVKDNAFIGPNAAFTNDLIPRSPRFGPGAARYKTKRWIGKTVIDLAASIGANATILCGITIGRFAMIGGGAVVTRDVPPYALVFGVPGEIRGYVCKCGRKLRFGDGKARCSSCGEKYKSVRGKVANIR